MSDIMEEVGQVVVLRKSTSEKTIDGMGTDISDDSNSTEVNITVSIQPLNAKELQRLSQGRTMTGMKKMYAKPTYSQGGTDYTVEPGDEIVVEYKTPTEYYRVESTPEDWDWGETAIYNKHMLRRIR